MAFLESQKSAQVYAASGDTIAPAQVTGLGYTLQQGKVNLSWTAVTLNEDDSALTDLAGYRIFRKKNAGDSFTLLATVGSGVTTYQDATMKDGATYYYAVAAIDDEATPQEGAKSLDLEVKTIPSVPTGLIASGLDGSIRLDWTSVQTVDPEVNENLAGYRIYRSETDGSGHTYIGTAADTETSFEDSSVVNGVTYYYVISAYDNSL